MTEKPDLNKIPIGYWTICLYALGYVMGNEHAREPLSAAGMAQLVILTQNITHYVDYKQKEEK